MAWIVALSMGLGADDRGGPLLLATLVCMGLGFMNYACHALVFSRAGFMSAYQRLRRCVDVAVVALFGLQDWGCSDRR